jgi:hypothetical protein
MPGEVKGQQLKSSKYVEVGLEMQVTTVNMVVVALRDVVAAFKKGCRVKRGIP